MTTLTVPPQTFMAAEFHALVAETLEAAQGVKGRFRRELKRRAAMLEFAALQCDELQRVKAERDADAERYRWLRGAEDAEVDILIDGHFECCADEELDALIDAAILREQSGESGEKNG